MTELQFHIPIEEGNAPREAIFSVLDRVYFTLNNPSYSLDEEVIRCPWGYVDNTIGPPDRDRLRAMYIADLNETSLTQLCEDLIEHQRERLSEHNPEGSWFFYTSDCIPSEALEEWLDLPTILATAILILAANRFPNIANLPDFHPCVGRALDFITSRDLFAPGMDYFYVMLRWMHMLITAGVIEYASGQPDRFAPFLRMIKKHFSTLYQKLKDGKVKDHEVGLMPFLEHIVGIFPTSIFEAMFDGEYPIVKRKQDGVRVIETLRKNIGYMRVQYPEKTWMMEKLFDTENSPTVIIRLTKRTNNH